MTRVLVQAERAFLRWVLAMAAAFAVMDGLPPMATSDSASTAGTTGPDRLRRRLPGEPSPFSHLPAAVADAVEQVFALTDSDVWVFAAPPGIPCDESCAAVGAVRVGI